MLLILTARVVAHSATITAEAGDKQDPNQPFTTIVATAIATSVVTKEVATAIAASITAEAREKENDPNPATTVVVSTK